MLTCSSLPRSGSAVARGRLDAGLKIGSETSSLGRGRAGRLPWLVLRPITPKRSAIDQANEGLSWEPEAVRGRVKLALGEATSLDAQDASFDTVLLGEVLEHQVDP